MFDALQGLKLAFVGGPGDPTPTTPAFAVPGLDAQLDAEKKKYDALSQTEKDAIKSRSRWGGLAGSAVGMGLGYHFGKEIPKPHTLIWAGLGIGFFGAVGALAVAPRSTDDLKGMTAFDWGTIAVASGFGGMWLYMGVYEWLKK